MVGACRADARDSCARAELTKSNTSGESSKRKIERESPPRRGGWHDGSGNFTASCGIEVRRRDHAKHAFCLARRQ